VVHGATAAASAVDGQLLRRTVELLAPELPPGRVAAIAAQLTGATRAAAYALATRGASGAGHRGTAEDDGMPLIRRQAGACQRSWGFSTPFIPRPRCFGEMQRGLIHSRTTLVTRRRPRRAFDFSTRARIVTRESRPGALGSC